MVNDQHIQDFLLALSSDAPAPGGGAVSALENAMGAALTSMVCHLTLGRKKYDKEQEFAAIVANKAQDLSLDCGLLADRDAEAFLSFSDALKLPKTTKEECLNRDSAMQQALCLCTEVPLECLRKSLEVIKLTSACLGHTNATAVSDLGAAAASIRAAADTAFLNVLINVPSISDRENAAACLREAEMLLQQIRLEADSIYQSVLNMLSKKGL